MIEIVPITGRRGDRMVDTGLDSIIWSDSATGRRFEIGFADRSVKGNLHLHYGRSIPPSIIDEAKRALAERHATTGNGTIDAMIVANSDTRSVSVASGIERDEDEYDNDE